MIQCDIQGPDCKVRYHANCASIRKSRGKKMDHNNLDFNCPVCSDAETVEVTINLIRH